MTNRLEVKVSEQTGLPYTEVPHTVMWELVEYLSFQRVAVSYEYRSSHFTVCFLRSDLATAQHLLDGWANMGSTVLQESA